MNAEESLPEIFRGDTELERLNDGWLVMIWKENQAHLADLPLSKKLTVCGLDLQPEIEIHCVTPPDAIREHLTCPACLHFWEGGVDEIVIEKSIGLGQGRIERAATRFRTAIERCDRSMLPIDFQEFPWGTCGDATLLLGTYLMDEGFGQLEYVCGERGTQAEDTWHSHAWLERDGLVVDITADQFDEITAPVVVTMDGKWYDTFEESDRHVADYRIYDERTVFSLESAYKAILKQLEANDD